MFGIAQSDIQILSAFWIAYGTVHVLLAAFLKKSAYCNRRRAWHEAFEHSDLVLSVPFNLACALPAIYVTYELRNDRVWGRHWLARQVSFGYIAKNVQNSVVLLADLWGKPSHRRSTLMFLGHHFSSVFSYLLLLRERHADFYASMALISETTNIFLLYLQYCTGWNKELKKTWPKLYCVNGACLWLSFVPCRLVLFPTWLYLWFSDWVELSKGFTSFAMYWFVGAIGLLFLLSAIWFRSITLGLMKALGVAAPVEAEKTAQFGGERYGQGEKED
jgi:hypothetical protein